MRSDRFRTLLPRFSDARNWKRVRFWGYPTRAGFRYGEDAIAVAAILYWEAEDDRSSTCLREFSHDALKTARLFDVEVTEPERALLAHGRGVEAVDEATIASAIDEFHRERAERVARWKKKRERLRAIWRKKRAAAARARARRAARAEEAAHAEKTESPAGASTPQRSGLAEGSVAPPRPDAKTKTVTPDEPAKAHGAAEAGDAPRAARRIPVRKVTRTRVRGRSREATARPRLTPEERAARAEKMAERRRLLLRAHIIEKLVKDLGEAPMPVMETEGRLSTLLADDHYVAGIAAYRSWPGTCLVQAYAVKVGTDPELARKVRDRWLADQAPLLRWQPELTEAPPIQNR